MTTAEAKPRTPSVSQLQAALLAARQGAFAGGPTGPAAELPTRPAPRPPVADRTAVADQGSGVWLVGTHGGSGARCLSSVLHGTRHAGKRWPDPSGGRDLVVLVCRSSQRGLASAQDYARGFRDGALGERLQLLGVIVSAAAPGRTPPALRRFERLLSGAVPILGEVPWQPAWRLGPPQPLAEPPSWLTKLQQALAAARPR